MGISIFKVRIENFRSIKNLELTLSMINVVIGANNCGKSNFLKAMNVALGQNRTISSDDIYVDKDEVLDNTKCATIDIMLRPVDDANNAVSNFSDFWIGVFTEEWITTGDPLGDYVGIRTILQYDALRNDYIVVRKQITDWGDGISSASVSRRKAFTGDMNTYISAFYMDAQRDVVDDIKDRKSYFGRATSRVDLPQEKVLEIERQLNDVNSQIVDSIPALSQTATRISAIAATVGAADGAIQIEPLARKMTDLHKGMDVVFRDGNAARLSVSQHGMGTRSWISFLTLGAYVDWEKQRLIEDDSESESYIMLTMEEPEAHLHPQAQQKLYSQLCNFSGQKIISTHSPSVVSQANLENLIHFEKINGRTTAHNFDAGNYTQEEKNRIRREVISSRGELYLISMDIQQWRNHWSRYCMFVPKENRTLTSFRNQISLGKTREIEDNNGIALLTAHMSKGLQFDVVFIIGLSEGTFPDYRAVKTGGSQLSQEMNNMYVAVTRAKRLCYMTYPARKRMPWGDIKTQYPSRYIKDIVREKSI